jgi:excisionase family DNA binding protein
MSVKVEPLTYSIAECAAALRVSRRTVSNAIHNGQLPAVRIGGRVLISRAVLAEMFAPPEVAA